MLFIVLVTSTKHYWVISAERRRPACFAGQSGVSSGVSWLFVLLRRGAQCCVE
jgi:hypothetical protein